VARRKSRKATGLNNKSILVIIVIIIIAVGAYFYDDIVNIVYDADLDLDGNFAVHFIDVGQGDSILIQSPENYFMLIDTGEGTQHGKLTDYLKRFGATEFKYVVFTHPHSDHIGSADKIVNDYKIETLIMPEVYHTSQTFIRLMENIENKNMQITPPKPGETFKFGSAEFTILAPLSEEYGNLNNHSVVIRMTYGNNSFLFTGDMEKESENEIIEYYRNQNITVDVLDVAHHGSSSSTQQKFLDIIQPSIAVIHVGKDNTYNHPNLQVIGRLESIGARILRTDLEGDIIIISDGQNLSVK